MRYWQKDIQTSSNNHSITDNLINRYSARLAGKKFRLEGMHKQVSLSYREAQIVVQLLFGRTSTRMADVLSLSPRTVEFYLLRIKRKLGCHKKSQLIQLLKTHPRLRELVTLG